MRNTVTHRRAGYGAAPADGNFIPKYLFLAVFSLFTAFALAPLAGAQTETVFHNFLYPTGGEPYRAGLVTNQSGRLYGTAFEGGEGFGVVFELSNNGEYRVVHHFSGYAGGDSPYSGVALDAAGNIYGTTVSGGASGYGLIYKIGYLGEYTILHSFSGGRDGAAPYAGVTLDAAGNLYGTAAGGGTAGYGVVYKLDSTGQYSLLHAFTGPDGENPYAGLTLDASGNLYGTTLYGGSGGAGVVYKIDLSGRQTVLHSFSGGEDGGYLDTGVILDNDGNLYGVAPGGGEYNFGVVYKLSAHGVETLLHTFSGPDGRQPEGALAFDAGNLYGVTNYGGATNCGEIFKIERGTHQETVFYSFQGTDGGCSPNGPLLFVNGNIFGTTYDGGAYEEGVIFKITPAP